MWHVNNAIVTTDWRGDPVNLPENGLIGVMYEDQVIQTYPFVVQNSTNWVYAGTGFTDGTSVPGIVGYEYDKVWNNGATPPGLITLSNSPVVGLQVGKSISNASYVYRVKRCQGVRWRHDPMELGTGEYSEQHLHQRWYTADDDEYPEQFHHWRGTVGEYQSFEREFWQPKYWHNQCRTDGQVIQ